MTTSVAFTIDSLPRMLRRGIVACAAVILLHALLAHVGYHAPALTPGHAYADRVQPPGHHAVEPAGATLLDSADDIACGTPAWVIKRLETLSEAAPSGAAVVAVTAMFPAASFALAGRSLCRPPGPDPQALLQRFTL